MFIRKKVYMGAAAAVLSTLDLSALNNHNMSDEEVVLSYVPPRYLFFFFLRQMHKFSICERFLLSLKLIFR